MTKLLFLYHNHLGIIAKVNSCNDIKSRINSYKYYIYDIYIIGCNWIVVDINHYRDIYVAISYYIYIYIYTNVQQRTQIKHTSNYFTHLLGLKDVKINLLTY